MNWPALRVFIRVAELSSFSKAAAALGSTQPTVSRLVSELEANFGGALFYRTGRGTIPTELGSALLPRARLLLQEADQLRTDALAFGQSPAGIVSVAILPSVMHATAARLYRTLEAVAPNIRLRLVEAFSDQIESWLAQGDVDIGLLCRYGPTSPEREETLFRENLLLLRARGTKPMPATVPFDEIAALPLVLPSTPNGLRLLVDDTARRRCIKLNVVLEADSLSTQKDVVRECGCYAIVADKATEYSGERQYFDFSRIVDPEMTRVIVMKSTLQRPSNRATQAALYNIRNIFINL